jgi:acyl-homoserine lactone acylase PvdQ
VAATSRRLRGAAGSAAAAALLLVLPAGAAAKDYSLTARINDRLRAEGSTAKPFTRGNV